MAQGSTAQTVETVDATQTYAADRAGSAVVLNVFAPEPAPVTHRPWCTPALHEESGAVECASGPLIALTLHGPSGDGHVQAWRQQLPDGRDGIALSADVVIPAEFWAALAGQLAGIS